MNLIVILLLVLLIAGGGFGWRQGLYASQPGLFGGIGVGTILVVLIVLALLGYL